jgi:hypothetical protein
MADLPLTDTVAEEGDGGDSGANVTGSMSGIEGGTDVPIGSASDVVTGVDMTDHIGVAPEKSIPELEKSIDTPRAV